MGVWERRLQEANRIEEIKFSHISEGNSLYSFLFYMDESLSWLWSSSLIL